MLINNWLVVMKLASNIIKKWADGMGLPLEMEGYVHWNQCRWNETP